MRQARSPMTGPYLEHLKHEIALVSAQVDCSCPVAQLHWGGGTPTFLTPEEIRDLFGCIRDPFTLAPDAEIGIEVGPRATTKEQCRD